MPRRVETFGNAPVEENEVDPELLSHLTKTQKKDFLFLYKRLSQPVALLDLMEFMGKNAATDESKVHVRISRLRKGLEEIGSTYKIETISTYGYILLESDSDNFWWLTLTQDQRNVVRLILLSEIGVSNFDIYNLLFPQDEDIIDSKDINVVHLLVSRLRKILQAKPSVSLKSNGKPSIHTIEFSKESPYTPEQVLDSLSKLEQQH